MLADQHRSASTTSNARFTFRHRANLRGGEECLGSIGIEERSQVRIPTHDLRDVESTNSHVLEEPDNLSLSVRNPLLDEWQAPFAIDRVERLKYQTIAPLAALAWNQRDKDIVIPGFTG